MLSNFILNLKAVPGQSQTPMLVMLLVQKGELLIIISTRWGDFCKYSRPFLNFSNRREIFAEITPRNNISCSAFHTLSASKLNNST
jgi:hypothetical protein